MHRRINDMSTLLVLFDLILTQAVERYSEMEPKEIRKAIKTEWKEQTGVLLREFFFRPTRSEMVGRPALRYRLRKNGKSVYIDRGCHPRARLLPGCHR